MKQDLEDIRNGAGDVRFVKRLPVDEDGAVAFDELSDTSTVILIV